MTTPSNLKFSPRLVSPPSTNSSPVGRSNSPFSLATPVAGTLRLPELSNQQRDALGEVNEEPRSPLNDNKVPHLPNVHRNLHFGHIKGGYAITKLRQLQADKSQRKKFMSAMAEVPGAKRIASLSPKRADERQRSRRRKNAANLDCDSLASSTHNDSLSNSSFETGEGPFVIVTKGGLGTHLLDKSKKSKTAITQEASSPGFVLPAVNVAPVPQIQEVAQTSVIDDVFDPSVGKQLVESSTRVNFHSVEKETFLTSLGGDEVKNFVSISEPQPSIVARTSDQVTPQQPQVNALADQHTYTPNVALDDEKDWFVTDDCNNIPKGPSIYCRGPSMAMTIKAARDRRGAALALVRKHHLEAQAEKEARSAAATRRRNQAVFGHQWATEWMTAIKLVRSLVGLLPAQVATSSTVMAVRRSSDDNELKENNFNASNIFASSRKAKYKQPTDHFRIPQRQRQSPKANKPLSGLLWDVLAAHHIRIQFSPSNALLPQIPQTFGLIGPPHSESPSSSPRRNQQSPPIVEMRRNKYLVPWSPNSSKRQVITGPQTILCGGFLPDLLRGRRLKCRQALLFLMARWWRIKTFRRTYRVAHIRFNFILRKNLPFFIDTFRTRRRTENVPLVVRFLRQYKMAATVSRALHIYYRHVKFIQRFVRRRQVIRRLLQHAMRLQWEVVGRELCYQHRLPSFLANVASGPTKTTTASFVANKLAGDAPTYIGFNPAQSSAAFTPSSRPPHSFLYNEETISNSCYVPIPTSIREAVIKRCVQYSLAIEATEAQRGLSDFMSALGKKEASHQNRLDKVLHPSIKGYMALPALVESTVWCIVNAPRLLTYYGRKEEAFSSALAKIADHSRKKRHLEAARRLKAEQEHRAGVAGAILKRLQTGSPSQDAKSLASIKGKPSGDNEEEEEPIYFTDAEQRAVRTWGVHLFLEAEKIKAAIKLGESFDNSRRQSTAMPPSGGDDLSVNIAQEAVEPLQASLSFGSKASAFKRGISSKGFIEANMPSQIKPSRPIASPNATKLRIAPQSLLLPSKAVKILGEAANISERRQSNTKSSPRANFNIAHIPLNASRTRLLREHSLESILAEERLEHKRAEALLGGDTNESVSTDNIICRTSDKRCAKTLLPLLDPTTDSFRILHSTDIPGILLGKRKIRCSLASKKLILRLVQCTVASLWQAQQVYCNWLAEHSMKFTSTALPTQLSGKFDDEECDEEALGLDDLGVFTKRRYSLQRSLVEAQLLLGEVPQNSEPKPVASSNSPPVTISAPSAQALTPPPLSMPTADKSSPKAASPPKGKPNIKGGRGKKRTGSLSAPRETVKEEAYVQVVTEYVNLSSDKPPADPQPAAALGMLALGKLQRPHQTRLCCSQLYKMLYEPSGARQVWDQLSLSIKDERSTRETDEAQRILIAKERLLWAIDDAIARSQAASGTGIKATQRFMPRSRPKVLANIDPNEQSARSNTTQGTLLELHVPQLSNLALASELTTLKILTVVGARCYWLHFALHSTNVFGKGRSGALVFDMTALEQTIAQKPRMGQGAGGYKRMQSFSAASRESVIAVASPMEVLSSLASPTTPPLTAAPTGGHPIIKAVKSLKIIEVPQRSVTRLADAASRLEAAYTRRAALIREWIFGGSPKGDMSRTERESNNPFAPFYANTPSSHLSPHHPHNYYQHHYATFSFKDDIGPEMAIMRGDGMVGTGTVEVLSLPMCRSLVKTSELWMEHIVPLSPNTLAVLSDMLPQRVIQGTAAGSFDTFAASNEARRDFKGNISVHQPTLFTSRKIKTQYNVVSPVPSNGVTSTTSPIDELRRIRRVQQDIAAQRLALIHRYTEETCCCVGELFPTEQQLARVCRRLGASKETDAKRIQRQAKIELQRIAGAALTTDEANERTIMNLSSSDDEEASTKVTSAEERAKSLSFTHAKVGSIAARTGNAVTTSVRQPPLFLDLGFIIDVLLESV